MKDVMIAFYTIQCNLDRVFYDDSTVRQKKIQYNFQIFYKNSQYYVYFTNKAINKILNIYRTQRHLVDLNFFITENFLNFSKLFHNSTHTHTFTYILPENFTSVAFRQEVMGNIPVATTITYHY